jgi:tetratricopeptide (TPR) repeat protein
MFVVSIEVFPHSDSLFNIPDNSLSWYNPIENTDSLKNLLNQATLIDRVNIMCEISYSLLKKLPEESNSYAKKAFHLADSIDYSNGRVMALYLLASKDMPGEYDWIKSKNLLLAAERYMDEETHWVLKYRLWFGIGSRYKYLEQLDSCMYYYEKPLLELDEEECWFSHLGSYSWLASYARLKHRVDKEHEYLKKFFSLILKHHEYHKYYDEKTLLMSLEKLSAFYTSHGEYQLSVETNHRVLDSIYQWNISSATRKMFIAKYLGKIGRAYHHWGKFDSAIRYHDSSLFHLSMLYEEHLTELNNSSYPTLGEWSINYANQLEEKSGVQIMIGDVGNVEHNLLQSVDMRRKYNDVLGVAMSYDKLGEFYEFQGKYSDALQYYDSALFLKMKFQKEFIGNYGELGAAYWYNIISESLSLTYLKMGQLYQAWDKKGLAIEYFTKSQGVSKKIDYLKGEAEALTNLGDTYLNDNNPDSALSCFNQAHEIYQNMGNRPGIAMVYEKMGNFFSNEGNIEGATENYQSALNLYQELDMPGNTANVLYKQGTLYFEMKEMSLAISKFRESLEISERLDLKQLQMKCHSCLADIYENHGDIENAFLHYRKSAEIKDLIYNLESNKQIAEIETRFETENKEQQILLLQKENELQITRNRQIIFTVVAIFVLLTIILLLILLYIRQYRLKAIQEKTTLQQKLLRSQMNPHFIFNSLASIQNSIINEEPQKASKYLARFSKLVRNILDSSVEEFITLEEELSTIENYLELQKIRFPEKFEYTIEVDETLDPESVLIPPMLAQPFIENAIEHGIKHKETKGKIDVRFQMKNGYIEVEVEDDGIGRQRAQEILRRQDGYRKSLATNITKNRIQIINKKLKGKIILEIKDLYFNDFKPAGLVVSIKIPLI